MTTEVEEEAEEARRRLSEAEIERESVEQVFGLTGGELESRPWEPWVAAPEPDAWEMTWGGKNSEQESFPYHYEGVPDYAGSDFPDKYGSAQYCTVVTCALFGGPPEVLREPDEGLSREWKLVGTYNSSGETECPGKHDEEEGGLVTKDQRLADDHCVFCEEELGEEHGYIYLGDGWVEAVYRSEDPSPPLEEGFDVGTLIWSKYRADNYSEYRFVVAAGPAPEDEEGCFVVVSVDPEDDGDEAKYVDASTWEAIHKKGAPN